MTWRRVILVLAFLVAVALLVMFFNTVWWWIEVHTGTVNEPGPYYGFWSGFGSDLGEYAIAASVLGSALTVYKRHKCQSCPRLVLKHGMGRVEGTHYETCHVHTEAEHHAALKKQHKLLHPKMHHHFNPT